VEPLEVLWGTSTEPDATERWDRVDANVLLVALKGACADGVLDNGEPFGEERGGALVGGQKDDPEPAVPRRLGHLHHGTPPLLHPSVDQ
jgi:hypothetical protein